MSRAADRRVDACVYEDVDGAGVPKASRISS